MTLLTHAPTSPTAAAAFPADESLDPRGRVWAEAGRTLDEVAAEQPDEVGSAPGLPTRRRRR